MTLRLQHLASRLATPRLELRAFEPRDAARLFKLVEASRAHLEPWLHWPRQMTSVEAIECWAARPYDATEAFRLGIYTKAGGELVGAAGLQVRSISPPSAWKWVDISYWLGSATVGQGYATEAARRLAVHAFDDLGAPRVEIRTERDNAASGRVAERLGFRREGVLRSVAGFDGRAIDLAFFALVAQERGTLDL
jgi:ribosomal-protein-serine acetyltransferase